MGELESLLTNGWDWLTGQGADTTGMNDKQAATYRSASSMQHIGVLTTIMGGVNQAIGGYFAAEAQRYQAKSQALNLTYQSDMAAINARSAEYEAQSDLEAGKSQIFNQTMQAGQQKASSTARTAASGIRLGSGSAQEISASEDIVKDINMYTINANATRAAAAARTQGTNFANQSLMDRTSAINMRRTADSVSPFLSFTSSLMTSASSVAQQWNNSQRLRMMMAGGYLPSGGNF